MAVYEKLLLSSGGGVISERQQADQVKNTATLLIGLGGTGVDCLRTIKTQVYSRLKPDEPRTLVPHYEHIRFLGVDSDDDTKGSKKDSKSGENDTMELDGSEFFSIGNKNLAADLANEKVREYKKEISWLNLNKGPDFSYAGAGGIRQIGRYMMMCKSEAFIEKVRSELTKAKMGLPGNSSVDVHIFSGLSGGTGSGTFLDVCYMVRSLANEFDGITMFGYFFLPDVNEANVQDLQTKNYIPVNGYAAMQELDYCMRLSNNGGKFTQRYAGNKTIEWDEPPVNMCHLISATTKDGSFIPNAYRYAMNVTAEYVMDYLTATRNEKFGIRSQMSNLTTKLKYGDSSKQHGYNLNYCAIGASCAQIPLREINTYLASELFDKFSVIEDKTPSENEVKEIVLKVMGPTSKSYDKCYEGLLRDVKNNMSDEFNAWQEDFKDVLEGGDSDFVEHYRIQLNKKKEVVESNCKGLLDAKNKDSLMGRLKAILRECIIDVKLGPTYANKVMEEAESHNFWNFFDGLVERNRLRLKDLNWDLNNENNKNNHYDRYKAARDNFRDKKGFGAKKRFEEYEFSLQLLEKNKLEIYECEKIAELLENFRKQYLESEADRYRVLARITGRLMETFRDNKATLASEDIMTGKSVFAQSLMTIKDLKDSLDAEVAKLDIPNMMKVFMEMFLEEEPQWRGEDEKKISQLVTKFFMDMAFDGFANRTITDFLKDKYNIHDNEALTNKVYEDWIKPLTDGAAPMFHLNQTYWSSQNLSELAFVSVPSLSEPIKAAAEKMHSEKDKWEVKESALTDRIYVMSTACVFPMCAYNRSSDYEKEYFSAAEQPGRHYYEGTEHETGFDKNIDFDDWRKLPSITPQSLIELEKTPAPLAKIVREGQELYERVEKNNAFDDDNEVLCLNTSYKVEIEKITEEALKLASEASKREKTGELEKKLQELESYIKPTLEKSGLKLEQGGYKGDTEVPARVREDYFVSSPAYWKRVENIVSEIEEGKKKVESAVEAVRVKIDALKVGVAIRQDYFDALFTGVFELKGKIISYKGKDEFGEEIILSQIGDEFPYGKIPVYQAFKSYEKMDPDTKKSVKEAVQKLQNEDNDKLCVAQFQEFLSSDRIKAWIEIAKNSFENSEEIKEFVITLNDSFKTFCNI